ncbi:penicillin-binding transpeptidase domain-containing protein [Enterococcus sp. BWR-S5]|uniref:penicillin-binding transpeptidase domain-containing protein n=1 Tax=Enterococcus sp. BWR-S5 TaxID=2787714 RepID=UPI0019207609|nr:penicillin-binding transpeptidase domain-containing protein [Enterococcus sp. BWR-S5]MBL1224560.1 penicillin-binding protein 2 [Enterococcus sp. BWR-S5]
MKLKSKHSPQKNRKMVGIILLLTTLLVFVVLAGRLIKIVASDEVSGVSLKEKTKELYNGMDKISAKRGSILDSSGNILAEDSVSFSIYAVLDEEYVQTDGTKLYVEEKHRETIANILHTHAGIEKSLVIKQLTPQKNEAGDLITTVEFGEKGNGLNFDVKNKIEDELEKKEISGIYFREGKKRLYLNGKFASYFLGYTSITENEEVGMMGIEAAYDDILRGKEGSVIYQKDKNQNSIPGTEQVIEPAQDGAVITTTLDSLLQLKLEELLQETADKYKPQLITASLMEAETGKLLALSQRPTFEPETLAGLDEESAVWLNLLTEEDYEPGSTMKPFTMAAAMSEGIYDENERFLSGQLEFYDVSINDWNNGEGKGEMTFRQALAWSSNVGMVTLEERMPEKWQEYIELFGFLKSTDIKVANEVSGTVQTGTPVDRAMTSYGQAISVTHLQMQQAYTAIANEGKMMKPYLVEKITYPDGTEEVTNPEVVGTPISKEVSERVLEYMSDVVHDAEYGTGNQYAIEGISTVAKTGTAEFSENGIYNKQSYLHSVVQIAPKEDPKYIFYMTIKAPTLDGTTANDIISTVSNQMLTRAMTLRESN